MLLGKQNKTSFYLLIGISIPIYIYFAYFLDRTEFNILFGLVSILFLFYLLICRFSYQIAISKIINLGMLLRGIFILSLPILSDDIYRFLWDGSLWHLDINPFAHKPSELINSDIHIPDYLEKIYPDLNSKDYYSIYPPFNQIVFYLSTIIGIKPLWISTVIIHIFILINEFGILKLFQRKELSSGQIAIYAFNPLIILEFSGNLHFEVFMIFFLLYSLELIKQNKLLPALIMYSLAVMTKLWPLMFLPLFFGKLKWQDFLKFSFLIVFISFSAILFITGKENIYHFFESLDLYFRNFEFNASIFYLGRSIGINALGYDPIQTIGPVLSLLGFIAIIIYAWFHRNKPLNQIHRQMIWVFVIYLSISTVVHPWYIGLLIAFSVMTNYRFPIVWSFLIFLSYFAYSQENWKENLWLIAIEYLIVFIFIIMDLRLENHDKKPAFSKS